MPTFLDPSPQSVASIRESAHAIAPRADLESWYRDYALRQSRRLAVDLDIVSAYAAREAAVLEIGAAPPILTLALAQRELDVKAVDIDPARFAETIAAYDLTIAGCDIETEPLPFADRSFDVVILNEVLEHLRINPVFTLREARRALRDGGTLLLSTPNLRSLNGIRNLLVHGRSYAVANNLYEEYEKLERVGHMGHVREYAPGDVKDLLGRVGFDVTELIFRSRQRNAFAEAICRMRPEFRRDVSYVARAA